ncbi:SGNH/GDSL hydrolase family protein [Chungangia koreensis]|uniref:SGNH/GDSL hydrolase family protein n=1 Tax=Chungangia koreensis TaxID=752657 RepID=A0ABV8X4X1_9LACT
MKNYNLLLFIGLGLLLFFYSRTDGKENVSADASSSMRAFDPTYNPDQSIADFLTYRALLTGQAKMAVTGSSVTKGSGSSHQSKTWRGIIQEKLRYTHKALRNLTISNYGHSGYTSVRLLEEEVTAPIISEKPDVLFIETSVINNHNKNVTIEETLESLVQLHKLYSEALPNTKIYFMSPNPCTENKFGPEINSLGYTFIDYVNATAEFIKDKGWAYFDTHGSMLEEMEKENIALPSTLKDGIHPNDKGYAIWGKVLSPYLVKKGTH